MTIGERIKKVRQEKHLTQQDLAERMGIKRNTIAIYETNRSTPSIAVISLICREFHVNEAWLRTGKGEMYAPEKEELLLNDPSLDDADRALLNSYIEAPPALRKQIRELLCRMVDRMLESQQAAPAPPAEEPATIDEKVEAYRAELEAEEKAKERLSALQDTGEESA